MTIDYYNIFSIFDRILVNAFEPMSVMIYTNFALWIVYSYNNAIFSISLLIIIASITIVNMIIYICIARPFIKTTSRDDVLGMNMLFIFMFKILIFVIFIYTMIAKNEDKLPLIILMVISYIYIVCGRYLNSLL